MNTSEHVECMVQIVRDMNKQFKSLQEHMCNVVRASADKPDAIAKITECLNIKNKILKHPRNRNIRFELSDDGQYGRFMVNIDGKERLFAGLTRTIAQAFFNCHDETMVDDADFVDEIDEMSEIGFRRSDIDIFTKEERSSCGSICKANGRGKIHGTIVHEEMKKFVDLFNDENNPDGMASFFRSVTHNPADAEVADGCTIHLLQFLIVANLLPVASELAIYDEQIQMATQIDLICVDANTLEVVVIELKTGYTDAETFVNTLNRKPMRNCLSTVADTPCMRASTQLAMTVVMLQQRYDVVPHKCYVFNVVTSPEHMVHAHALPDFIVGGEQVTPHEADLLRERMYVAIADVRIKKMAEQIFRGHKRGKSSSYVRAKKALK